MNLEQTKSQIIDFIKTQAGDKPVIVGLSGGLDSSVVAYLATEALGADKVHGLIMPSDTNTAEDFNLAQTVADNLHIPHNTYHIKHITESFIENTDLFKDKKSLGNLKARVRMSILYGKTNELDGLVLGTGNKTEIMTGYSTKYGDAGCDILPIGDLYKTDERELAKYLGVPQAIIDRPPTAGLWFGQTDEEELGITYTNLDKILKVIENHESLDDFDSAEVTRVQSLIKNSEHKRALPPICKI